jgi:enoyl-[acyl-carrier protein] reductase I
MLIGKKAVGGGAGIRVNAPSPGPLPTRAADGLDQLDDLLAKSQTHRAVTIEGCGVCAAVLASDAARNGTDGIPYVGGGLSVLA